MTARPRIAKCTTTQEPESPSDQTDFPSLAACGKPRPPSWVVPGLVLESVVNVVQGKKSAGKSCFYAWVAAVYLGVIQLPGRSARKPPGRRVLLASEEPYRDFILPRFKALGVKPSSVLWVGKADGSSRQGFALPDQFDQVERAVKRQNVGLFIGDSLAHFLAAGNSANDEGQVRSALEPFIRLGENDGVTSLFTQHMRKSKADSEIEQGRGSGSIYEVARCVVQLQRNSVNPTAGEIKCVGANAGGDGRRWGYSIPKKGKGVVFELGSELTDGEDVDLVALTEAAELTKFERMVAMLRAELKDGEQDAKALKDIAEQQNASDRTLWAAAVHLGIVAKRVGKGKSHRSLWSLPNAGRSK